MVVVTSVEMAQARQRAGEAVALPLAMTPQSSCTQRAGSLMVVVRLVVAMQAAGAE